MQLCEPGQAPWGASEAWRGTLATFLLGGLGEAPRPRLQSQEPSPPLNTKHNDDSSPSSFMMIILIKIHTGASGRLMGFFFDWIIFDRSLVIMEKHWP